MTTPLPTQALYSTPLLAAFNHVLDQSHWAKLRLQPFAGRTVRIALAPFSLSFSIAADGRLLRSDANADLTVTLPADMPLRVFENGGKAIKAAEISGPGDLADTLSYVMEHLRWDIEADLSKAVGDIAAHRIKKGLDSIAAWHTQAARNLAENVGEYLIEEKDVLVKVAEVTTFAEEVKTLHQNLDRIEAKLARWK